MRILTTDGRLLNLVRFGKVEAEQHTNIVICLNDDGKRCTITPQDIQGFFGSYTFPPLPIKEKNELIDK